MFNKLLYLPFLSSILVACAPIPTKVNAPILLNVIYFSPVNDLLPQVGLQAQTSATLSLDSHRVLSSINTFETALMQASICDESKDKCSHAVTHDSLTYKIERLNGESVRIYGTVDSKIGRTLTIESGTDNFRTSHTRSLPAGVELIDKKTGSFPFDKILFVGEKFQLPGLLGAHFDLRLVAE